MSTVMHRLRDAAGTAFPRWLAAVAAGQLTCRPVHAAAYDTNQQPEDAAVPAQQPAPPSPAPPSQLSISQPALPELLASLHAVYKTMSPPLTLGELVFGMQVLVKRHADRVDTHSEDLEGKMVTDKAVVHQLLDELDIAQSAYRKDPKSAAAHCRLKLQHIVSWQPESSYLQPGHYVAVDHMRQQVVVVIRGTRFLSDLLIDLTSAHPLAEGHTHWGMHQAALWLVHCEGPLIQKQLAENRGYSLHLVGHSLGGGIASLIAYMAHHDEHVKAHLLPPHMRSGQPGEHVQAVCFAPPCIMSKSLAASCRPYVTSVIHAADLVPRLNALTLASIRAELQAIDWVAHMKSQMSASRGSQVLKEMQEAGRTYVTSGLQQLAGALLPLGISRNLEASMQALMAKGLTPRQAALQLVDSVLKEPMRSYVLPRLAGGSDSAGKRASDAGAAGSLPGGDGDSSSSRGVSGVAVRELMRRLLEPALRGAQPRSPTLPASLQSPALAGAQGAAVGSAGPAAKQPDSMVSGPATGEPDLSSWTSSGLQTAEGVSQRLRSLQSLPSSARDALAGFFSTTNTAEVMRIAGLMLRSMGAREGGNVSGLESGAVRQATDTAGQQQGGTGRSAQEVTAVSGPILYPAGKLYYLQRESNQRDNNSQEAAPFPAAARGDLKQQQFGQLPRDHNTNPAVYSLTDVPPDAAYFRHALLTSHALHDHRSRAYRAGLLGVLQGLQRETR